MMERVLKHLAQDLAEITLVLARLLVLVTSPSQDDVPSRGS